MQLHQSYARDFSFELMFGIYFDMRCLFKCQGSCILFVTIDCQLFRIKGLVHDFLLVGSSMK